MRIKTATGISFVALAVVASLAGCSSSGDDKASMDTADQTTAAPMDRSDMTDTDTPVTGAFAGLNDKMVAGDVTIADGMIALSGFSSDEGPDLHLYLTNGTDEAAIMDGVELGAVAFDMADQTFDLNGADAADYSNLVVHCDKAKAVFGAADLA